MNKSNLFDPSKQKLMTDKIGAMNIMNQVDKEGGTPKKEDKTSPFFKTNDLSNNIFA